MQKRTIREFRLRCGYTQYELARRAKLSQSHVSVIERGLVPLSPRSRRLLARALNVRESALDSAQ